MNEPRNRKGESLPESSPKVSIIIVSYNARQLVEQCLPSVVATRYPNFEIIFADNASTDDTAAWVARTFPDVRIVRHPENWAFCKGNNAAALHATGQYLLFLNNDVEVSPDWLLPLVRRMESDGQVAAVQPKLLQYVDRSRFEYAGGAGGFLDRYGYPFTRGRLFLHLEEDQGQYDDAISIFWATGAALLIRKVLFDRLGGFEERFFMHMEEIDLCWRLQRLGYRIMVEPKSCVFHIGGASLPQGSPEKTFLNFRNNLLTLYRNLPHRAWVRVFMCRIFLDGMAALRFIFLGSFAESFAVVRAYREAHRMRRHFESSRPSSTEDPVLPPYSGRIVIDYHVRRIHRFSDLPQRRFSSIEDDPLTGSA